MADVTISALGDLTPSTGLFLPVSDSSTTGKVTLSQVCGVMTSAQITTALGYTPYNSTNPGTGAMGIPVGTTAQRPASPQNGMIRYNTSTQRIETFYNNSWLEFRPNVTPGSVSYTVGNHTFTAPAGVTEVKVTVIGGGGGGGGWQYLGAGNFCGGGSGGVCGSASGVKTVTSGASYAVVVGAAGVGCVNGYCSGTAGGQSSFNGTAIYATGGGGGPTCSGGSGGAGVGVGGSTNLTGQSLLPPFGSAGAGAPGTGGNGGNGGAGYVLVEWF